MTTLQGYGKHVTIDGYGGSQHALADLELIYNLLDKLPGLMGMSKLIPPYVLRYNAPMPEDWGITGFVLIAESHISIHTYPEMGFLTMDVYSCKDFDEAAIVQYVTELFGIGDMEINVIGRGKKFGRG